MATGVAEIIDANLLRPNKEEYAANVLCVSAIMELALRCSAEAPEERMNMRDVLEKLKKIKLLIISLSHTSPRTSNEFERAYKPPPKQSLYSATHFSTRYPGKYDCPKKKSINISHAKVKNMLQQATTEPLKFLEKAIPPLDGPMVLDSQNSIRASQAKKGTPKKSAAAPGSTSASDKVPVATVHKKTVARSKGTASAEERAVKRVKISEVHTIEDDLPDQTLQQPDTSKVEGSSHPFSPILVKEDGNVILEDDSVAENARLAMGLLPVDDSRREVPDVPESPVAEETSQEDVVGTPDEGDDSERTLVPEKSADQTLLSQPEGSGVPEITP
ncbi:hypothetical protein Vadar_022998 [Vaccinium darrowii]|uniref:Uncharacterized protein n=1 Tax=Vaccinium darrowii TaxID=229202 RepID=A0ACB7XBL7_9ERIC|nr:hypothetical protein Vadar_022998 [Vaccinium darrowii]